MSGKSMSGTSNAAAPEPQFKKDRSAKPRRRKRSKGGEAEPSAFDVIINRTLTVTQNGKKREVTVEEALQHKTYQDALAGDRTARTEVLKMIAKREEWLAARAPRTGVIERKKEGTDPRNADEAMLLLGIADPDPRWSHRTYGPRLLLEPWAVQAALSRPRRKGFEAKDVADIKRCTRDPESLVWAGGLDE